MDGGTDWGSAEVTQALDDFAKVLTYTNSDASALSWQDAAQLVIDGDAAFNVMGDWAEGFFREIGMVPNEVMVGRPFPEPVATSSSCPTASCCPWARRIATPPLPG